MLQKKLTINFKTSHSLGLYLGTCFAVIANYIKMNIQFILLFYNVSSMFSVSVSIASKFSRTEK